jgi:hypothetical protein
MAQRNYKITITEHDHEYTTYVAWVQGSSQNQAVAKAAAMAGQEKTRRAFERMGRPHDLAPEGLLDPEIRIELVDLDEYWDHREEVIVQ